MDNKNVPYIVHEGIMARVERTIERLWIVIILLIILLVSSNAGWLYYESQFSTQQSEVTTIKQELDTTDGGNAIINDGVHINGESKTDNNKN